MADLVTGEPRCVVCRRQLAPDERRLVRVGGPVNVLACPDHELAARGTLDALTWAGQQFCDWRGPHIMQKLGRLRARLGGSR